MAELNAAIARLEQVTDRLMRFEASLGQAGGAAAASAPAATPAAAAAVAAAAPAGGSAALGEYDALLTDKLAPFMAAASSLGGEVLQSSKLVERAFQEQRKVLLIASKAKQPEPAALQGLLQRVAEPMMAAGSLADNRRSPAFQQLKVVAEALQGLSWLAYTGPSCGMHAPAQHIAECWNAAEFFSMKLLKEFRGVEEGQVAWVKAIKELFSGLQAFVRGSCPGGLRWNAAGVSLQEATAAADTAAPATAANVAAVNGAAANGAAPAPAAPPKPPGAKGPPPPPPPPPPGLLLQERPPKGGAGGAAAAAAGGGGGGAGGMQEVLKALQQGSAVTSGLRKVTDDMKSKNRADRSGHVTAPERPAAAAGPAGPAGKAAAAAPKGPPRIALEQERKWVVENQVGQQALVVEVGDPKRSVYIYNCSGSVVTVKGKCNAISVDKCVKSGVVFETVIASAEMVNCTSIQVQCTGSVPTLSVDKCDGVQAYIPAALAANPDFQVVTAKSSEVNVLVLPAPWADGEPQGDVAEHAVPEQFISCFKGGKLVTTAASHGGG